MTPPAPRRSQHALAGARLALAPPPSRRASAAALLAAAALAALGGTGAAAAVIFGAGAPDRPAGAVQLAAPPR